MDDDKDFDYRMSHRLICLMELFMVCPYCMEPATAEVTKVIGTKIYVTQKCPTCKLVRQWKSQPNIRRIPAGNLLLSAAILYSDSMTSLTLRIFKILKVECFSRQMFCKHQKNYLIPVVMKLWKEEKDSYTEYVGFTRGSCSFGGRKV